MEEADCKVLTAKIAKDIADRTSVTNTYQIGEVCQILAKENPELRGKGGCWAIVSAVNDFSCSMRMWDGEHTVGLHQIKSFNYLPQECQQMQFRRQKAGGRRQEAEGRRNPPLKG